MTEMFFGNVSGETGGFNGFELIETNYLGGENADTVVLDLSQYQMYILFSREITISSGAVRGYRARLFVRTENDGTLQAGNLLASSNSGINMTVDGETLTIKPSSTSYDVYYALYAVM